MSNSIDIFNRKMKTLQPPPWRKRKDKDKEIQRLREALEVILDSTQKENVSIPALRFIAYTALKKGKDDET